MGQLYLSNIDFLKNGVPASIIATLVRLPGKFPRVTRLMRRFDSGCRNRRISSHESDWVRSFSSFSYFVRLTHLLVFETSKLSGHYMEKLSKESSHISFLLVI